MDPLSTDRNGGRVLPHRRQKLSLRRFWIQNPDSMLPITVLLADDHKIIRDGLRSFLKHDSAVKIIGEARNGRDAVKLTKKLCPAVVVMDISMPVLNGLDATEEILSALPKTRILVLSAHSDDGYINRAVAVGAAGFVSKKSSARDLSRAIREVHQGKTFFGPGILKRAQRVKPVGRVENRKQLS
jgi:DNA-binding NarL/FixJ family response regulator